MSIARSPVAPSPTPFLWTTVQSRTGVFSGPNPAPIHQPLPTNMLLSHYPTQNAVFPDQLDSVLRSRHHRYRQIDEERLREELSVAETSYGSSDTRTFSILCDLADVLIQQGRYKSGEEVIRRVTDGYGDPSRHQSVQWLKAMDLLGGVPYLQGLYPQALQLQQRILQSKKAILQKDHPSTLPSMVSLSMTYTAQKKLENDEMLAAQAVEILSRTQGEEHPLTIFAMRELMLIHNCRGRFDKAEELGLSAVATGTKVLGEQDPDTLMSMSRLAIAYAGQGRWKEAEDLEVKVIDIRSRVLGEEHPNTLASRSNLARIYFHQSRLDQAEELGIQLLGVKRRVFGEKHPSTLYTISLLILVYQRIGQPEKAEEFRQFKLEVHLG